MSSDQGARTQDMHVETCFDDIKDAIFEKLYSEPIRLSDKMMRVSGITSHHFFTRPERASLLLLPSPFLKHAAYLKSIR